MHSKTESEERIDGLVLIMFIMVHEFERVLQCLSSSKVVGVNFYVFY